MEDLNQLQQLLDGSNTTGGGINASTFDIGQLMAWIVIPSALLTLLVCLVLVVNMVRRWKVEKAIFEIRDTLREMKMTGQPAIKQTPSPAQTPVADTEPEI